MLNLLYSEHTAAPFPPLWLAGRDAAGRWTEQRVGAVFGASALALDDAGRPTVVRNDPTHRGPNARPPRAGVPPIATCSYSLSDSDSFLTVDNCGGSAGALLQLSRM